jgi:hypothetical protein
MALRIATSLPRDLYYTDDQIQQAQVDGDHDRKAD